MIASGHNPGNFSRLSLNARTHVSIVGVRPRVLNSFVDEAGGILLKSCGHLGSSTA